MSNRASSRDGIAQLQSAVLVALLFGHARFATAQGRAPSSGPLRRKPVSPCQEPMSVLSERNSPPSPTSAAAFA